MANTKPNVAIKFSVFTPNGNGYIEISGEDVSITTPKNAKFKKNYIDSITKIGDLALNKVDVNLAYYDLFGSKEQLHFAMSTAEFQALKKILGK